MNPVLNSLPILILSAHNRCNCRCVMCDIWKTGRSLEITEQELERHVADIAQLQVEWVVFTGGEPLMHSHLFRLCRMLRKRKLHITLLTTGLLLERYRDDVVEHMDDVVVSLDGPPDIHDQIRRVRGAYDSLARGVRAIQQIRPEFPLSVRSTVQRRNCSSLVDTAATARSLEVKSISFLAADLTSDAFNREGGWLLPRQDEIALTASQLPLLDREIQSLIDSGLSGGFVLESAVKLRRLSAHFRAHLGLASPVAPACNAPWVSAVVEAGGAVRPCFFHPPIGNLNQGRTLLEVLNGAEAEAFRTNLDVATDPVCARCVCSLNRRAE